MNYHSIQHDKTILSRLFSIAEIGVWDWDIPTDKMIYHHSCSQILGYSKEEFEAISPAREQLILPAYHEYVKKQLELHVLGESPLYEAQYQMLCKNGELIWIQDKGQITSYDESGKVLHITGILQNITALKNAEQSLHNNYCNYENTVQKHNREMIEQEKLLYTINQISKKLLTVQHEGGFDDLVQECLCLLGESIHKGRVYIWKDYIDVDGNIGCTQIYEWYENGMPSEDNGLLKNIPYSQLPTLQEAFMNEKCINSLLKDFTDTEKTIITPEGIQSVLIAPIAINGNQWGFIGVDNYENEELFTSVEETMLLMSGSMLANAIDHMETEAVLREMEERTQLMLNATPLCCNLWTSDYDNMKCNDEAVRLFELSDQQEYLQRFHELSPEFQPNGRRSEELSKELITKAFQDGYCRFEWLHQKLDGTPVPAEITLVRIKYKDDFIVAGYTRDLREEKAMLAELKTKDALRVARDEALLISQAKSNFLANMSHEIRTPMNAISGFADIILRESTNEKTTQYAKGITNACSNLINIINDILDISKIESGKAELSNAPYELASVIQDVVSISRMRLGEKPLMFITDIDSRLPARLIGDEIRLKQILINILSNAIKYTQEGYVSLRISSVMSNNQAIIRFSVKDSGIGIKPEDLERLFYEFERINTTKTRSIEGTGLGLAISKQLCDMMGGKIEVKSTYKLGSEFIISIPQECPSYERLVKVNSEQNVLLYEPRALYRFSILETLENLDCKCIACENQSEFYENLKTMTYSYVLTSAFHLKKVQDILKNYNLTIPVAAFTDYGEKVADSSVQSILFPINCLQLSALLNGETNDDLHNNDNIFFTAPSAQVLVVDDNPVNLQVAAGLMEPYEFTIDTADNGFKAIEMIHAKKYDLVFMDHMMPEMDGVDTTVAIRQFSGEYYQQLPIIALTANALVGTKEMFLREGMNDFLAKPVDIGKLSLLLAKWLPQSKMIRGNVPSKSDSFALNNITIKGVNTQKGIAAVGGNIEHYLQILSSYYTDGKSKCLSLPQNILQNNISLFRTEVHALKSTSATIGALELSEMAADLEAAAQKNDSTFIDNHLHGFLFGLESVLDAIQTELSKERGTNQASGKAAGNMDFLKDELNLLTHALEFAHISLIEESIQKLQTFTWPENIATELLSMQKYVDMFDYDNALSCVLQIKQYSAV